MTPLPARLRDLAESLVGCEWNHPITAVETCRRAAECIERIETCYEKAIKAAVILREGIGGHNHWDDTQQHGAGCAVCKMQLDAKEKARVLLVEVSTLHMSRYSTEAAAREEDGIRDCSTCRSLVGCEQARGGGPQGFSCWQAAKAKGE